MRANSCPKVAFHLSAACALLACSAACFAQNLPPAAPLQTMAQLAPFSASGTQALHPAWRLTGLPTKLKVPNTRFELAASGGETVLQISTDKSYGVLTHVWQGAHPAQLAWRWRVPQALADANLSTKAGGGHQVFKHAHRAKGLRHLIGTANAVATALKRRRRGDATAIEFDFTGIDFDVASDQIEQRGLPGPVGAENTEYLALGHRQ